MKLAPDCCTRTLSAAEWTSLTSDGRPWFGKSLRGRQADGGVRALDESDLSLEASIHDNLNPRP